MSEGFADVLGFECECVGHGSQRVGTGHSPPRRGGVAPRRVRLRRSHPSSASRGMCASAIIYFPASLALLLNETSGPLNPVCIFSLRSPPPISGFPTQLVDRPSLPCVVRVAPAPCLQPAVFFQVAASDLRTRPG